MKIKNSTSLKALSLTLAVSVLWLDFAWALDPQRNLSENQVSFDLMAEGQKAANPAPLTTNNEVMALDAVSHQETIFQLMKSQETLMPIEAPKPDKAPAYFDEEVLNLPAEIDAALNAQQSDLGAADITYQEEFRTREALTEIKVNTLKPAARGSNWAISTKNKTLTNANGNRYLEYKVMMDVAGAMRVDLSARATGSRALPDGYDIFKIAVYVDGIRQNTLEVAADKNSYHSDSIQIDELAAGFHKVRLVWENDAPNKPAAKKTKTSPAKPATGTQITLKDISFKQVTMVQEPPADFVMLTAPPAETNRRELTVLYRLDGAEKQTVFSLMEGANDFVIEAIDAIGRRVSAAFSTTLDTTPPTISVIDAPGEITSQSDQVIRYLADGEAKEKSVHLTEGDNQIFILEKDAIGNAAYKVFDVVLDTTPPVILPISDVPALTRESQLTLQYLADGVLNRKVFDLTEGENALRIEETDSAGNQSAWEVFVTLDSIAPTLSGFSNVPVTTDLADLTVTYLADGIEQSRQFNLVIGDNALRIEASDELGNTAVQEFVVTRTALVSRASANNDFTLRTADNSLLSYVGGELANIQTANGDYLSGLRLDDAGRVLDAEMRLHDGSLQLFQNGQVVSYVTPDGTTVYYADGRVQKAVKDGEETNYTYDFDADGNLLTVTLDSMSKSSTYGHDERIKETLKKSTGQRNFYENGVLQRTLNPDGSQIVFKSEGAADGGVRVSFERYLDAYGNEYLDENAMVLTDGSILADINWNSDGRVVSALLEDSEGNVHSYLNDEIAFVRLPDQSILSNIKWNQEGAFGSGILRDESGDLFTYVDGELTQVILSDGSLVSEIRWGASGELTDYVIEDAKGARYIFEGGQLSRIRLEDATVLENLGWDIFGTLMEYDAHDINSNIMRVRSGSVRDVTLADGTTLESIVWGAKGGIQSAASADSQGNQFVWSNGKVISAALADGSTLSDITWSSSGLMEAATSIDSQSNKFTYANGKLVSVLRNDGTSLSEIVIDSQGLIQSVRLRDSLNNEYYIQSGIATEIQLNTNVTLSDITWNGSGVKSAKMRDISGNVYDYDSGQVKNITFTDGAVMTGISWDPSVSQPIAWDNNGNFLNGMMTDADSNKWLYVSGSLKEIYLADGSTLRVAEWDDDQRPQSGTALDLHGNTFTIASGQIESIKTSDYMDVHDIVWGDQGAIMDATVIDTAGNRITIKNGLTAEYKPLNGWPVYSDITWNSSGRIQRAVMADSEGNQYQIMDGRADTITFGDGSVASNLVVNSGGYVISCVITDGRGVRYNFINPYITSAVMPDGSLLSNFGRTFGSPTLDAAKLTDRSGVEYSYVKNMINGIRYPDGTVYQFSNVTADVEGQLLDATLTETDASGWTQWTYVKGAVTKIYTSEYTTIQDPTWNADGTISGGTFVLADGSKYQYEENAFIGAHNPNGSSKDIPVAEQMSVIRRFSKNKIAVNPVKNDLSEPLAFVSSVRMPLIPSFTDPIERDVSAVVKPQHNVTRADRQVTQPSLPQVSNLTLNLTVKDVAYVKSPLTFLNPEFLDVQQPAGAALKKPQMEVSQKTFAAQELSASLLEDSVVFESMLYDARGNLTEIRGNGGSTLRFEEGVLKEALDVEGELTSFDFARSEYMNFIGAKMERNGAVAEYDVMGKLTSVKVMGAEVRYKTDSAVIDAVTLANGTQLTHIRMGATGDVQDAVVRMSEGDTRVYEDGRLAKIVRVDTSELNFAWDPDSAQSVLSDILTADKLRYTFDYSPDKITAVLDRADIVPMSDTVVRMEYDSAFRLLKTIQQNNNIVEYNPRVQVSYLLDGTAIAVKEGSQSFYNTEGELFKVILPPADGELPLEVRYADGKIRDVYRLGQPATLVYRYSYVSTPDDTELVRVEDVASSAVKTYSQGRLLTSLGLDTNVLETYFYEEGSEQIARIQITRLGRPVHVYDYSYDGPNTIVTDEDGDVRTYGADKKLMYLDRAGERFGYTYTAGASVDGGPAEEIVTEELLHKELSDLSTAYYSGGALDRIELADGSTITEVALDAARNLQRAVMTLPDGVTKIFDYAEVSEEILPDGTHFYYQSGRLVRAVDASGLSLDYAYDTDGEGHVAGIQVHKGDVSLMYSASGDLTAMKLDSVLEPAAIRQAAAHEATGGVNGEYSYDGLWNTAQTDGFGGGSGNTYRDLYSTTMFSEPSTVSSVTYRMFAHANSSGGDRVDNGSSANTRVEYLDAITGQWMAIPETVLAQSHNNGGGGGSTAYANTATSATVAVRLANVLGLRAYARAGAYANGGGNLGGSVAIYDLDYTLEDQSVLSFSPMYKASGEMNGYAAVGALGAAYFNDQGTAVSDFPSAYASASKAFDGQIDQFLRVPHADRTAASSASLTAMWTQAVKEAALDANQVTFQEYSSSGILEAQTKADGTVTLFNDANKPSEVLDASGRVIMQYFYDVDGNPSRVYLKNARDVLPDEVAKAGQSIQEARAASLLELAKQKNLAYQTIYSTAETQKNLLVNEIQILAAQRDGVGAINAKGKAARAQKAAALEQMDGLIADYHGSISDVASQAADAYAALDAQVQAVSAEIEANAQEALAQLALQETVMKREIIKQENSPVIYDYYRRILGRDPSSSEYEAWADQVNYDSDPESTDSPQKLLDGKNLINALSEHLQALPELAERTDYVRSIKNSVRDAIAAYLALDRDGRTAHAAGLGLAADDLIDLSAADAQKILIWLDSRSLHFGQSAFLSLEALLDQRGIAYAREDIARRSILIDILSGVISPLDEGDIVISVFALNTVAKEYGLNLEAANLTWEGLASIYAGAANADPLPRVIAHINGNHFVIITSLSPDSVTYIDPGIGKDKENESVTVTREGFLKAWSGNVTANAEDIELAKALHPNSVEILSAEAAKSIRGAFWGSLLSLVGSVLSWIPVPFLQQVGWAMTVISTAVAAAEGDFLTAIGNLATLGLGDLKSLFSSVFDGLKTVLGPVGSFLSSVGGVAKDVYSSVVGVINGAISYLPGIGGAIHEFAAKSGVMNVGAKIVNTALTSGLTYAANQGLTALGVSPQMAGFISSLATATLTGALHDGVTKEGRVALTQSQSVRIAVTQVVTLDQVGRLGLELGLDSNLASIIGMSIGAIQGQHIALGESFELVKAFEAIKPDLTASLEGHGLARLSPVLGIDPRISGIIGLPIAGAFGRALESGRIVGEDIIQSIYDGLTGGAIQIGLDFAIDELDIDSPLLESLASAALTQSVSSFLDPNGHLVEDLLASAGNFTERFVGKITSTEFMQYADQHGYVEALEAYASNIFSGQALEEIHGAGGIAQIISGRSELVDYNGITLTKVNVTSSEGFILDNSGTFVGTVNIINGIQQASIGQFNISNGKSKLINGSIRQVHPNGEVSYIEVRDGKAYRLVLRKGGTHDPASQATVNATACEDGGGTCYKFDFAEGQATEPIWDWEVVANYSGELTIDGFDIIDGLHFINGLPTYNVTHAFGDTIFGNYGDSSRIFGGVEPLTYKGDIDYLLLNGIRWESVPEGNYAGYFNPNNANSFVGTLGKEGVDTNKVGAVALYEDQHMFEANLLNYTFLGITLRSMGYDPDELADLAYDGLVDVLFGAMFGMKDSRDIQTALDNIHTNQIENYVPIAYSGAGRPLIQRLNTAIDGSYSAGGSGEYYNVESVILVGAPLVNGVNTHNNIDRIINIYGDEDLLKPFIAGSFPGVETISIELTGGITHMDYFYDPERDKADANNDGFISQEENDRMQRVLAADAFIARLSSYASEPVGVDPSQLDALLGLFPIVNGARQVDVVSWASGDGLSYNDLKQRKGIQ